MPRGGTAVDWEAIEREYRAGQLSVVEIGRQHGVSHTAINKKAKKLGWARNLAEQVRQEVSARLLVSEEVSAETAREAVETAAARGVDLVRQHRRDIREQRDLVRGLAEELKAESGPEMAELREAIEEKINEEKDGRRRAAMLRAVSLPSRAAVMRDLAQAGRILIDLERQAFNLDELKPPGEKPAMVPILNVRLSSAGPGSSSETGSGTRNDSN